MFIIVYKIYYCNFIYVFRDEYELLNWWGEWILNIFDVCDNCNEMVWVSFVDSLLGLVNYYNFY